MNTPMNAAPSPEYLAADNSAPLLGTSVAFLVLETICITLLYVSRYLARGERVNLWMDILMTAAYIVCVSKITIILLMIEIGGTGRHIMALPPHTTTHALKLSVALQIVCPLTTSISKLGVLCLLEGIFGKLSKWYRIAIRTTFALVFAIMIGQMLIPFLNCRPFSKSWHPEPTSPGSCAIPSLSLWRYLGTPNVLTTVIIVAIPAPAMATLHVSRPVKFGLVAVFSVCLLGIVASIMRLQSFLQVTDFNDITYEDVTPLCWTIAESGIILVAGAMLKMKPLLKRLFKGTVFEKMLTRNASAKQSKSWKNNTLSCMRLKGDQAVPVETKKYRSLSDTSKEEFELEKI